VPCNAWVSRVEELFVPVLGYQQLNRFSCDIW
jgi:hypothetical protein